MGSRQPKAAVPTVLRRHSAGDESSEVVQHSLQQINTDLARILTLLRTRPPAFTYPSVTPVSLGAEPVTQPFADPVRGSRVTPIYPESSHGIQSQVPYQSGPVPEPYQMRGAGVPVLPIRQGQAHSL